MPIIGTDPTGMDTYLEGSEAQEAFMRLQRNTRNDINTIDNIAQTVKYQTHLINVDESGKSMYDSHSPISIAVANFFTQQSDTTNPSSGSNRNTNTAKNLEKASAAVQLGTDVQATTWGTIAKFGSKELEKFGRYATGTGGVIATGDLSFKIANGTANWKDYTSFGLAWLNVGLMKANETAPNVVTGVGEVVVGVITIGFDIFNTITSD